MRGRRILLVALLVAAVLPYFVNLDATSIIDANEAFYAETPREMIESGDFISPAFNYEPRLNKPPLSYWVVAAFYRVFGVSLGAARLPIALGAVVILATVFLLGRLAFSTDAGLLAALTLAATPRMLLFSRRIIIDMYTAMFVGLALLCFALAEARPARRRRWLLAMYVATALGVLTKGPVAVAMPALVFTAYLALSGRLRTVTTLMLPAGALIIAAIVVPYYVALYGRQGWGAISSFLLQENLARYAGGVGAPDRGPFFYLPVVFADLYFPWSLLLPAAFALVPWRSMLSGRGWSRIWGGPDTAEPVSADRLRLLLGLWIVLIVAFFSMSKGQQDLYVLPFVVAGGPLVGGLADGWIRGAWSSRLSGFTTASAAVLGGVIVLLGAAAAWIAGRAGSPVSIAGAAAAGLVLAAGGIAGLVALARGARAAALASIAAALVLGLWVVVLWSLPGFERYKPVPQLAQAIEATGRPQAPVATYSVATPSLVFYLRRHVTQLFDEAQLRAFLAANADGLCVMRAEDYDAVRIRLPAPTRVLVSVPRLDAKLTDFVRRSPVPALVLIGPA
jgi:4-amino-4-deoxy-L-arabinose transferase-like glycosyltransferase